VERSETHRLMAIAMDSRWVSLRFTHPAGFS
jgi:hypothetical protein